MQAVQGREKVCRQRKRRRKKDVARACEVRLVLGISVGLLAESRTPASRERGGERRERLLPLWLVML